MPGSRTRRIGSQTWPSRLGKCISPWQQTHSVIRFSSESWPEWLRDLCGGLPSLTSCHTIDNVSHRDAEPAVADSRATPDPASLPR